MRMCPQCLDWLFCSGLMVERVTIVRYDDWSGPDGHVSRYGEKRAHAEISQRHGVTWEYASLGVMFYRVHSYTLDAEHCAAHGYDANERAARLTRALQHTPPARKPQQQLQPCHERVRLWKRQTHEGMLAECVKAPGRGKGQGWAVGVVGRLPMQPARPSANCSLNSCHKLWDAVLRSCAANGETPAWITGTELKKRCPSATKVSAGWSPLAERRCLTPVGG